MPRKKTVEEIDTKAESAAVETPDEKSPVFLYDLNLKELDRDLTPEQQKEWTAVYASFRARAPLTGTVIGTELHEIRDSEADKQGTQRILCVIAMQHRVKIIIPHTEIWHSPDESFKEVAILGMVGATIDYVVMSVDRINGCALGSRKIAMDLKRRLFISDKRGHQVGDIVKCCALSVGPNRLIVECNGFDFELKQSEISYTPMADMRNEFKVGHEFRAKIKEYDPVKGITRISIKEMTEHPYIGAEERHPKNSMRQAVISGTYAGGLFCRLLDDTTVMCSYSPGRFSEDFYIGDTVILRIRRYDDTKRQIYGTIAGRQ